MGAITFLIIVLICIIIVTIDSKGALGSAIKGLWALIIGAASIVIPVIIVIAIIKAIYYILFEL